MSNAVKNTGGESMKLMILGASILQLPAILEAKNMGVYTVVCDYDSKAIGAKYSDAFYCVSTLDESAIMEIANKEKIDGIMTLASDRPMPIVAKVAEKYGLPAISYETAVKATNKAEMRRCLSENNVPIPAFVIIESRKQYDEVVSHMELPLIVKPADNSGSRGIYLVKNESELNAGYEHAKQYSNNGTILVEEYMDGPEVSVEAMTQNGITTILAITDKLTTGAPHFVELGHTIQSQLSEKIKNEIYSVAKQTISAIGITNGPSHTELKITNSGVKVVEIGARLGGDNITTKLVPLATGVNMVELCIKNALGIEYNIAQPKTGASAIRYFQVKPGKVKSIDGVAAARSLEGIKEVNIEVGINDIVHEIVSSNSRIGFVIAEGANQLEAIERCNKAMSWIQIEVEK